MARWESIFASTITVNDMHEGVYGIVEVGGAKAFNPGPDYCRAKLVGTKNHKRDCDGVA